MTSIRAFLVPDAARVAPFVALLLVAVAARTADAQPDRTTLLTATSPAYPGRGLTHDGWLDQPERQPATDWPARLAPATRAALVALADTVRATHVPVGPLYDKAAEGVLKGADDARIVAAVRALAGRMTRARAVLGASATAGEIQAGAGALAAGVSSDALRDLVTAHRTRGTNAGSGSLAVSLSLVADLVGRQVPPDAAAESMRALLARGVPAVELSAVWERIRLDIDAGASPRDAVLTRTRAVIERVDGIPAERAAPRPRVGRPYDGPLP